MESLVFDFAQCYFNLLSVDPLLWFSFATVHSLVGGNGFGPDGGYAI